MDGKQPHPNQNPALDDMDSEKTVKFCVEISEEEASEIWKTRQEQDPNKAESSGVNKDDSYEALEFTPPRKPAPGSPSAPKKRETARMQTKKRDREQNLDEFYKDYVQAEKEMVGFFFQDMLIDMYNHEQRIRNAFNDIAWRLRTIMLATTKRARLYESIIQDQEANVDFEESLACLYMLKKLIIHEPLDILKEEGTSVRSYTANHPDLTAFTQEPVHVIPRRLYRNESPQGSCTTEEEDNVE